MTASLPLGRTIVWLGLLTAASGVLVRLLTITGLAQVARSDADTVIIVGGVLALSGALVAAALAGAPAGSLGGVTTNASGRTRLAVRRQAGPLAVCCAVAAAIIGAAWGVVPAVVLLGVGAGLAIYSAN